MANVQRLLGTMLASRMAGRGGIGGTLGSAAMMGLGGPLLGSKMGLAVLGYLAYRSSRSDQTGDDRPPAQAAPGAGGQASGGLAGVLGGAGLGGALGGIVDQITGGRSDGRDAASGGQTLGERIAAAIDGKAPPPEPEETLSDARALLLIRAMIAAANSDGSISQDERRRICDQLEEAGVDAETKRLIERELDAPKSLDTLLRDVNDEETAQQFYLASRAAIDGGSKAQKSYLEYLRQRLKLPAEDVETVERLTAR